jgi:hypothetical protein
VVSLSSGYQTKILYELLISPMRAICSAHLVLLHLITLITFCEEYSLQIRLFSSLLHLPSFQKLRGLSEMKQNSVVELKRQDREMFLFVKLSQEQGNYMNVNTWLLIKWNSFLKL